MSQNLFSNINGSIIPTLETEISSSNEAVRSQYGLYEAMLIKNGQIEWADLHWQRLWKGLAQLGFNIPKQYSAAFFEAQILELAARNGTLDLGRIRIQFYAEELQKPFAPFYFIEATSIDKSLSQWNEKGLELGILQDFRKPMTPESNCKINHSLHIPLAKKAMAENNWDDALLLNSKGRVIESSMANLFWIKEHIFFTTPLSEGCLEGTMRYWVMEQIRENGYQLIEKVLSENELFEAEDVFLTNSIRRIKWVERIMDKHFDNQKTKDLYQKIFEQ